MGNAVWGESLIRRNESAVSQFGVIKNTVATGCSARLQRRHEGIYFRWKMFFNKHNCSVSAPQPVRIRPDNVKFLNKPEHTVIWNLINIQH